MVWGGGVCCAMWSMACQVVAPLRSQLTAHRGLPLYSHHENHSERHLVGTHISTIG